MMSRNSATGPVLPWVRTSGSGCGSGERTCSRCTFAPSTTVVNWGKWFNRVSAAPVIGQFLEVSQRHAPAPADTRQLIGPPGVGEPAVEVVEVGLRNLNTEGIHSLLLYPVAEQLAPGAPHTCGVSDAASPSGQPPQRAAHNLEPRP